jgi:hypothetical protein
MEDPAAASFAEKFVGIHSEAKISRSQIGGID